MRVITWHSDAHGFPHNPPHSRDDFPPEMSTYRQDGHRDGEYVYIGAGFSVGIGCSSGKLRIGPYGKMEIDTNGDYPTEEECARVREFLENLYPDDFNRDAYEMDA